MDQTWHDLRNKHSIAGAGIDRYGGCVPSRFLAFLLTAVLAVHALYGVAGDVLVLCLGGGHHHAPTESEHCENVCQHDGSLLGPIPANSQEDGCGCTDIELSLVDLVSRTSGEGAVEIPKGVPQASIPQARGTISGPSIARRSIHSPPVDGGVARRLALVASVRLTT